MEVLRFIVLIVLDHHSGVPLYRQVVEQVKAMIVTGTLQSGDSLPSIRQLASQLVISVITIKRAYEELRALGLITLQHGRGTFVARIDTADRLRLVRSQIVARFDAAIAQAQQAGLKLNEMHELLDRRWSPHSEEESQ